MLATVSGTPQQNHGMNTGLCTAIFAGRHCDTILVCCCLTAFVGGHNSRWIAHDGFHQAFYRMAKIGTNTSLYRTRKESLHNRLRSFQIFLIIVSCTRRTALFSIPDGVGDGTRWSAQRATLSDPRFHHRAHASKPREESSHC